MNCMFTVLLTYWNVLLL